MMPLAQLLSDVDNSVERRSGGDRALALCRITDLFAIGAESFSDDQIALFDEVIQRFATAIETRARVDLAERLAKVAKAPPGILATLAHDEIVVARPVLVGATRLDDQTLIEVAALRGRDHMLAICERPKVSPAVTDALVSRGDGVVRHAIVANAGALFSMSGTATLIDYARKDIALGELMSERVDLPEQARRRLIEIAKDAARQRIQAALPGSEREIAHAVERGASALQTVGLAGSRNYAAAAAAVESITAERSLVESDLVALAERDHVAEVIAALASMTGLSVSCLDRIFEERDNDLLIVIGKARNWSWATVQALLRLRDPALAEKANFRRAEETFGGLDVATAGRVIHFLKVRETAGRSEKPARSRFRIG